MAPRTAAHRRLTALALVLAFASLGCRSTMDVVAPPGHALCPVCRCEGDLACLVVEIEPDTPHLVVDGETYWFCSEACRDDFAAAPQRFD